MSKREFATLAHSFNGDVNSILGWYVSRKLNGWGCLWDGGITRGMPSHRVPFNFIGGDGRSNRTFYSTGLWTIGRADKYGIRPKVIHAPDWFLDRLPKGVPLQGELWNEDDLQSIKSICGGNTDEKKNDPLWQRIVFVVYNYKPLKVWAEDCLKGTLPNDANPSGYGQTNRSYVANLFKSNSDSPFYPNVSFEERYANLKDYFKLSASCRAFLLPQAKITEADVFYMWLDNATSLSWEGLMLANPESTYETCRSYNLLKVKPTFDAEATIVGYEKGKTGKNIGKMGAIVCSMTWGEDVKSVTGGTKEMIGRNVVFSISGFKDYQREWDYVDIYFKEGTKVKFTFSGVSIYGVPQSCNIVHQ